MFGLMESFASLVEYGDTDEAVPRIISFSSRQDGWKHGRGKKPRIGTIANALLVAQALKACSAPKTGAFLNDDGTILVTGYYDGWHAEIVCLLNGSYHLVIESCEKEILDRTFNSLGLVANELTEQVKKWGGATPISVSTALTTTTSISEGFKAAVFPNRLMTAECQSFVLTAPLPQMVQYVDMRERNTLPSQVKRRFFGNSRGPTYRIACA